jgi:hypothetical protein
MTLAQLQAAYREYLLSGDDTALAPMIVADAFDAAERLAIHRSNFLISLCAALKASFPVTRQLVGSGFFEQAAQRFVLAHPPERPCLFEYGDAFPAYLQRLPQLAALPYVAEVARFEFARIAAYNAPAEPHLSADAFAGRSPGQLQALPIRLARHARVIAVEAPVLELWRRHQDAEPDLAAIDMTQRAHALLVCRPDRTLAVRELDAAGARFLAAADAGANLGDAAAQCGEDGAALSRIIALSLELRLLTGSPVT